MAMTCPACGADLAEVERSGVRIDACRGCRGVWLDRGDLDRVLERERQARPGDDEDFIREVTGHGKAERYGFDKHSAERLYDDYRSHRHHKKRRKSLLEELFD